jgi:hypothetical protein
MQIAHLEINQEIAIITVAVIAQSGETALLRTR